MTRNAVGVLEDAMAQDVPAAARPSAAARATIVLLGFYRRFISPALPRVCRFYPTCSAYALEAVSRYGVLRGLGMAAIRLGKCHPLHKGGFDPVK